jgi:hypothetical protein
MSIKELIDGNRVRFMYYRKGELWYEVIKWDSEKAMGDKYDSNGWDAIFQFPVPISDCGDGQFNAEDKAIYFMRYIRKYKEENTEL